MRTRELTEKNVGLYQLKREDILNILETKPIEWLKKINIKSLHDLANQVNIYLHLNADKEKSDYLISKNIKVHYSLYFLECCKKSFTGKLNQEYRYTVHLLKNTDKIFKNSESLDYIGEQSFFREIILNHRYMKILKNKQVLELIFNNQNHKKYYNKKNLTLILDQADTIELNGKHLVNIIKNMFNNQDESQKRNFYKDASCAELTSFVRYVSYFDGTLDKNDNSIITKQVIEETKKLDLYNMEKILLKSDFYPCIEKANEEGQITQEIAYILDKLLISFTVPLKKTIASWGNSNITIPEKLIDNIIRFMTTDKKEKALLKFILNEMLKNQTIKNENKFTDKINKNANAFKNVLKILENYFPQISNRNIIISTYIEKQKLSDNLNNTFEKSKKLRF